jgi:hypothetical protein
MAWIPLSTQDILNSLTEAEQSGTGSESAQSDLTVIVQSVTGLIRGKVNSAKRNQGHLGPIGTIPDELYAAAISIARFKYLSHLPGTQLITKERAIDKDEAYEQLQAAADGSLVVIRGDDVEGQSDLVDSTWGDLGPNLQGPPGQVSPGWSFWNGYW